MAKVMVYPWGRTTGGCCSSLPQPFLPPSWWCWMSPSLPGAPDRGLFVLLARNCMRLQVLELDHVAEINQEVAAEMCREGLKGLEMLVLTSTPVTPKALLHFNSE